MSEGRAAREGKAARLAVRATPARRVGHGTHELGAVESMDLDGLFARLEVAWGEPGLAGLCAIAFNPRLRTALGRFLPRERRVELNPRRWAELTAAEREELVVHEIAHAVVQAQTPRARPHGREWRELMRRAGYRPRARFRRAGAEPAAVLFEHRCPVCHATRLARRRVSTWRCWACLRAGLDGRLEVRRLVANGGASGRG